MKVRLVAALVLLLCAIPVTASADERTGRLWVYDAGAPIMDYRLSPLGNLIITTPQQIAALDPENGNVQWQREIRSMDPELTMIAMVPCVILHTEHGVMVLDLETGEPWWESWKLQLKKVYGFLPLPQMGAVLVFGKSDISDKSVLLVDLGSGETRWRQDALLRDKPKTDQWDSETESYGDQGLLTTMSRHQRPFIHDTGIVFYVSKDGLLKVDAETGRLLWRVAELEGKSPPMLSRGYAPIVVTDDVAYVPYDRKLIAVNLGNGSVAWHQKKDLKSPIRQMEMSVEGLVVLGYKDPEVYLDPQKGNQETVGKPARDFCMEVFNPETGLAAWRTPLTDLDAPLRFFVDEDYAFVPRIHDVILVDLQQGSYSQFAQIDMKGDEVPTHVERVGKNILVASSQNMVLLKSRGGLQYHTYYPAVKLTGTQKVMMVAAGFVLDDAFDTEMGEAHVIEKGLHTFSWAARPFSAAAIEMLGERYRLTTEGDNYRYIYTDQTAGGRGDYSLVKVDKATGKEAKRIYVGKQFPDYKVDLATDTVFVLDGTLHNRIFAVR